jgi:hypothetical protein
MEQYIEINEETEAALGLGRSQNVNGPCEAEATWSEPDLSLLGNGRRPAPVFPLSVLGSRCAEWVERRAETASAPVDYVAATLLAVTGALLANVRRPLAGVDLSEPPLLWIGLVGSPSSSKSPAMDSVFGPLRRIEDRMAADFQQHLSIYEMRRETAEAQREVWKVEVKAAVKDGGDPPLRPEGAVIPEEPERPRLRVADATVEKLGALSAALPRGLLLVRDELAGWFGAFDKYGGGGSDRAFAIEMYGGRSYTVDRMKNREPRCIRHLSIGVVGGIQPDKLANVIDGPDDGLTSRLLWVWPDALPRFKLAREAADDSAAQAALERLESLMMGSDAYGNPEPVIVRLSWTAENVLEQFAQTMDTRTHEACGALASALGKARGQALRLATVLEFTWWAWEGGSEPTEIGEQAVKAACCLVEEYFIPMAERVYGDAAIPVQERNAIILARYLKQKKLREFNARTLQRAIGGALREADAVKAACAALVEAGLIREKFSRAGSTSGKMARNYEVNPAVYQGSH